MRRTGHPEHQDFELIVCGTEAGDAIEVRELMGAKTVDEQLLAIDALRGHAHWLEEHSKPVEGKNFRDVHHWQDRKARRGYQRAKLGNSHEYTDMLRRDVHEHMERVFGWLGRLPVREVARYLNE